MVETSFPEAIIFGDERVSYEFVERALGVATSITRLLVPSNISGRKVVGTGWVIAPGIVVTNHHVVAARLKKEPAATEDDCREQAAKAVAWFDYRIEGGPRDERAVGELVHSNAALDYAIVRLKDGAGRKPLTIAPKPPLLAKGDRLNIVQHSGGGPLKYAIRSNHYVGAARPGREHFLHYLTDTEGGASGSPVFDDAWHVVALHHGAVSVQPQQHGVQVTHVNNEGLAIHAMLRNLPKALLDEIATAQGWGSDVAHP